MRHAIMAGNQVNAGDEMTNDMSSERSSLTTEEAQQIAVEAYVYLVPPAITRANRQATGRAAP